MRVKLVKLIRGRVKLVSGRVKLIRGRVKLIRGRTKLVGAVIKSPSLDHLDVNRP